MHNQDVKSVCVMFEEIILKNKKKIISVSFGFSYRKAEKTPLA